MAIREVIRMGHPTLRSPAEPYPQDELGSAAFRALITDMQDTLHAYGGIGLAAPQIDVPYRIAVIEIATSTSRYGEIGKHPFTVYVNPRISTVNPDTAGYWEGCLSIPGIRGYVERPQHILVDYVDESGTPQRVIAEGFLATVFQHEFDHLEGQLFIDLVEDRQRLAFDEEYQAFHLQEDEAS